MSRPLYVTDDRQTRVFFRIDISLSTYTVTAPLGIKRPARASLRFPLDTLPVKGYATYLTRYDVEFLILARITTRKTRVSTPHLTLSTVPTRLFWRRQRSRGIVLISEEMASITRR